MTQEDKQLLLRDLCARLPYGVKVKYLYWDEDKGCEYPVPMILDDINSDGYIKFHGDIAEKEGRGMITQYLPYLRPMSSMTEGECITLSHLKPCNIDAWKYIKTPVPLYVANIEQFDFFLRHHLDWRGLIPMGLALEAPAEMYKN